MSQKPKGIAARAGRWSAQHRKIAIFGWLAVVIAAFVLGGPFGTGTKTTKQAAAGDSGRAQTITDDAFPESTTGAGETVLVSMKDGWLSSAVGVAAVRGRERFGGGEQRSSLYRLFNVEDRAKWEARSGGAFPKRAVRRLDENGRLPERRAGCG